MVADLQAAGLLVEAKPHKLSLGRCQRCDTVVEPMLSLQWFVKTEPLAKPAIDAVEQGQDQVRARALDQDYIHWMSNIRDWCISRQLWWGHRIPAWYCPTTSHRSTSRARFEEACAAGRRTDLEQDDDVLDTWFSSALWPFSTLGWPEQTRELKTFYPTSVMETGHDIIFFWVARMMMMGLHFMKKVPFRTVLCTPWSSTRTARRCPRSRATSSIRWTSSTARRWTRSWLSQETSRRRRSSTRPGQVQKGLPERRRDLPEGHPAAGADALRFTLAVMGAQGRNIRLSLAARRGLSPLREQALERGALLPDERGRRRFEPLSFREALLYSRGIGDARQPVGEPMSSLADRWILSRLQAVTAEVDTRSRPSSSTTRRRRCTTSSGPSCATGTSSCASRTCSRPRNAAEAPRGAGHAVDGAGDVVRLLHPFMPFITEEMWQQLPRACGLAAEHHDHPVPDADAAARRRGRAPAWHCAGRGRGDAHHQVDVQPEGQGQGEAPPRSQATESEGALQFLVKATDAGAGSALGPARANRAAYPRSSWSMWSRTSRATAPRAPSPRSPQVWSFCCFMPIPLSTWPPDLGRLQKEAAKVDKDLQTLRGRLGNADFVGAPSPKSSSRTALGLSSWNSA